MLPFYMTWRRDCCYHRPNQHHRLIPSLPAQPEQWMPELRYNKNEWVCEIFRNFPPFNFMDPWTRNPTHRYLVACLNQIRENSGRLNVIFWKCIWEIRTDNPSLAVKILNGTPQFSNFHNPPPPDSFFLF